MNQMVVQCTIVNQYIVKEYNDKMTEIRSKNIIHHHLKRGGSVAQSKGHHLKFHSGHGVCEMQFCRHHLHAFEFGGSPVEGLT